MLVAWRRVAPAARAQELQTEVSMSTSGSAGSRSDLLKSQQMIAVLEDPAPAARPRARRTSAPAAATVGARCFILSGAFVRAPASFFLRGRPRGRS